MSDRLEQVDDLDPTGRRGCFENGAADGFNIMPAVPPPGLEAFTEKVVPALQDRGLFGIGYTGTTLRERYGLPHPENRLETLVAQRSRC